MDTFIKILFRLFLVAVAGIFLWPPIQKHFLASSQVATSESSRIDRVFPASVAEPVKLGHLSAKNVKKVATRPEILKPTPKQPTMYRWVDENGRVVYSDRPNHADAMAYTPREIGYLAATGVSQNKRAATLDRLRKAAAKTVQPNHDVPPEFTFSTTSAGQKHGYVLLTGRISDGFACKQLRIFARARSDTGRTVSGKDIVSYNGFGSTLYEIKISSSWNGQGRRPQWEPVSTVAVCLDPGRASF